MELNNLEWEYLSKQEEDYFDKWMERYFDNHIVYNKTCMKSLKVENDIGTLRISLVYSSPHKRK